MLSTSPKNLTPTPLSPVADSREVTPERQRPIDRLGVYAPSTPPQTARERRSWLVDAAKRLPALRAPEAHGGWREVRPAPLGPVLSAAWRLANTLHKNWCQPGQRLHDHLSHLYGDASLAEAEIERSLRALRLGGGSAADGGTRRRGKVAVFLPSCQPLYHLVTQVVLPATLAEQVRATTVWDEVQRYMRVIFPILARSMREEVSVSADETQQQWNGTQFGSMLLVHPRALDPTVRLSLALPAFPDVIVHTGSVEEACAMSSVHTAGCPVIMPQLPCVCTVVAAQDTDTVGQAASITGWEMKAFPTRPGRMPAATLVQGAMLETYLASIIHDLAASKRQRRALTELGHDQALAGHRPIDNASYFHVRELDPLDRVSHLRPPALPPNPSPPLTIYTYREDQDLVDYFQALDMTAVQINLFGRSPAVSYASLYSTTAGRVHKGNTALQVEDQMTKHGRGTNMCQVSGNEVSFKVSSLMDELRAVLATTSAAAGAPTADAAERG